MKQRVAAALIVACSASCSAPFPDSSLPRPSYRDIDFTVEGTVVDAENKSPIEGAYVVLTYRVPGKPDNPRFGGRAECVKAKGAYTGKDGRFVLPAEKLDGLVANRLMAIKPDYYIAVPLSPLPPTSDARHGGGPKFTVQLDMFSRAEGAALLKDSTRRDKHAYATSDLSQYSMDCWRAKDREDARAAIPFLEIMRGDFLKYYPGTTFASDTSQIIHLLESLGPSTPPVSFDSTPQRDDERSGTVRDAATKAPIEGAYVLTIYYFIRSGLGGSGDFCRMSRGMVTGKDGRFRFPIEHFDKLYPTDVFVIAPDYYRKFSEWPGGETVVPSGTRARGDRDVYLARQDPANPSRLLYFGGFCVPEFATPQDGAAYKEFREREDDERARYFKRR